MYLGQKGGAKYILYKYNLGFLLVPQSTLRDEKNALKSECVRWKSSLYPNSIDLYLHMFVSWVEMIVGNPLEKRWKDFEPSYPNLQKMHKKHEWYDR